MQNKVEMKNTIVALTIVVGLTSFAGNAKAQESTLYSFDGSSNTGSRPNGSLSISPDGNILYGITQDNGNGGYGEVFSVHSDGAGFTKLKDFGSTSGQVQQGLGLCLSADGSTLYGTLGPGGTNRFGSIYSIKTDGSAYSILTNFSSGVFNLQMTTLKFSGNKIYGFSLGGGIGLSGEEGFIFSLNADGSGFSKIITFNTADTTGLSPASITISGNVIYGTSHNWFGSSNSVFSVNIDGSGFKNLGATNASLNNVTLSGNTLFGTYAGNGRGIFSINTNGSAFNLTNVFTNSTPSGSLTLSADSTTLYGLTMDGGTNNNGTIYSINSDGSGFSTIYSLDYSTPPMGALSLSPNGSILYGVENTPSGAIFAYAVPEPSTYALFGFGALGILMVLRKKKMARDF